MVYKNKDKKINKIYYRKLIFSVILLIYFSGLCSGCTFALKNTDNFDYVQKVTFVRNLLEIEKTAISDCYTKFFTRDLIFLLLIIIFKYSGVLKGLCLCIPFIMAVQNTCVYTVLIHQDKIGIFNLVLDYILKDTAVSFMVILYLFVVMNDIIQGRENIKKDIRKLMIYSTGIILIYVTYIVIHTIQ